MTITGDGLTTTHCTTLDVAADNMNLALHDSAIMAWLSVCTPILRLLTISNAQIFDTADHNRGLQLRGLNLLRPPLNHPLSLVDDELFFHGVSSGLTIKLTDRQQLTNENPKTPRQIPKRNWRFGAAP